MSHPAFAAIVPMKAHSERLPNKNIRSFQGRPLYHWIVAALDRCPAVAEIIIDTDSEAILLEAPSVSKKVRVISRAEELRGDWAPFLDLLQFDVKTSKYDFFIQTHSTNPLLKTETISKAIETFWSQRPQYDSLFGAQKLRHRIYDKDLKPMNHDMSDRLLRSQDLPLIWSENSTMYLFDRETILKQGHRIGKKPRAFEVSDIESVDIDYEADFILAETFYKLGLNHDT